MAALILIVGFVSSALFVGLVTLLQLHAPQCHIYLKELVLYGKLGRSGSSSKQLFWFRIEKRYFSHFYFLGVITNTSLLLTTAALHTGVWKVPSFLMVRLQMILNINSQKGEMHTSIDAFTTFLTLTLFTLHILRRLLETWYLHVFSDGSMNILHYLVGIAFYPAVTISILAESSTWSHGEQATLTPKLTVSQISGLILLISASYYQHQTFRILADLRKNTKGRVETNRHFIPHGTLFNYLSSPHYLMEILIYIAFCALQNFQNTTFYSVVVFVLVNQSMYGLLAHHWYKSKFDDYPTRRKAVIPFLL